MVMRNRGEGSDAPHWWDDLPPKLRERFTQPLAHSERGEAPAPRVEEPPPPVGNGELIGELSRLVLAFATAVVGILLFLSAAVYFVYG
jgi:hypothetical protein